jgi:RNA recognition motif-containing protein
MSRRLYVGNLPFKTTNEDLTALFAKAGPVEDVQVMRDLATGRARGFAFVQMATDEAAQNAISEFNQFSLDGRSLVVNEARPRTAGGAGDGLRGGPPSPRPPRW